MAAKKVMQACQMESIVYEDKAAAAKAEYDAKYGAVKESKPKKPLSAYMLFSNHMRPDVKKANPSASFGEIAKLIGAKWRDLSENEKKKWKDLEDKVRRAVRKAFLTFTSGEGEVCAEPIIVWMCYIGNDPGGWIQARSPQIQ
eukprot:747424-Hanusia_phi.AAC.4